MREYLYHGGVRDLRVGDELLPPSVTGAMCTADLLEELAEVGLDGSHVRNDRVFLTTDPIAALFFAAMAPCGDAETGGDVYRCEVPAGCVVEPDADATCDGYSFECERAVVVEIVRRRVPRLDLGVMDDA